MGSASGVERSAFSVEWLLHFQPVNYNIMGKKKKPENPEVPKPEDPDISPEIIPDRPTPPFQEPEIIPEDDPGGTSPGEIPVEEPSEEPGKQ